MPSVRPVPALASVRISREAKPYELSSSTVKLVPAGDVPYFPILPSYRIETYKFSVSRNPRIDRTSRIGLDTTNVLTFSRFYVASCKLDRPKVRKTLVKYSNYRCRLSRKFRFFFSFSFSCFIKLNFSLSFVAKWRCQSIFVIDSARFRSINYSSYSSRTNDKTFCSVQHLLTNPFQLSSVKIQVLDVRVFNVLIRRENRTTNQVSSARSVYMFEPSGSMITLGIRKMHRAALPYAYHIPLLVLLNTYVKLVRRMLLAASVTR